MALFFDARWFDARLADVGLTRDDLGRALGLDAAGVRDLFRDQREIAPREIAVMAALLAIPVQEVASRAGVRTAGMATDLGGRVSALELRVAALEVALEAALQAAEAGGPVRRP